MYRHIASARRDEELERTRAEAEDRFGPVPDQVETLLDVARLRIAAERLGIDDISVYRNQVRVRPVDLAEEADLPEAAAYHRATRTLNLLPEPAQMGAHLPGWVRSMLEAVL
jgi:transcription-repair coupling factor (superfamily II helicase)